MNAPIGSRFTATVRYDDGRGSTTCEVLACVSGVPGLIVNQGPDNAGLWGVTHERSGAAIGWWTEDPELAVRFAHAIADLADWTEEGSALQDRSPTLGREVHALGGELGLERYATHTLGNPSDLPCP